MFPCRSRSVCAAIVAAVAIAGALVVTRVQAQPSQGKAVYDARCAECHGSAGKGDGPASALLFPRPRDFTSGTYKIRTTETGSVPTDDDLIRSVRDGLPGSAMTGWKGIIPDADIVDVVRYIKSVSPRFADRLAVVSVPAAQPRGPDSVARGEKIYAKVQCGKCHGSDGRGTGAVATDFEDDRKEPLAAANLTEPWTFHGGPTARDIFLRFRTGMSGTPMPSFKDAASDAEMWDLANYIVSLARKPVWTMNAQEVAAFYLQQDAQAKANPVKRGRDLVMTLGCPICHTPVDGNRRALPALFLAGGLRLRIDPFGEYPTGNLTSDRETGLGNWSDDEIKRVITRGILKDGTRLPPFPMDWPSFSTMKPDDLDAVVAYLRTVPPVYNKVPRPSRPFLPVYLWGKFRMLVLQQDPPIVFFPGNVGETKGAH